MGHQGPGGRAGPEGAWPTAQTAPPAEASTPSWADHLVQGGPPGWGTQTLRIPEAWALPVQHGPPEH